MPYMLQGFVFSDSEGNEHVLMISRVLQLDSICIYTDDSMEKLLLESLKAQRGCRISPIKGVSGILMTRL